jgi:hypothetical protein
VLKDDSPLTRPEIDMIMKRAFFPFSAEYVNARHKGTKWSDASFGKDFNLTDKEWAELRRSMAEQGVSLSDSLWTGDRPFILRQLRADLATSATLGPTVRYKILTEDDDQLNAALGLFPQASKLMSLSTEPAKPGRPQPATIKR